MEEELFIPMKSSYEYLKEDMELLSYVTRDDMLYVILEDDLYQIDIKQKSFQIVKEKLIKDRYVVSKSQASLAWMDQEEEKCMHTDHGDEPGAGRYLYDPGTVRAEDQGTGIYE